MKLPEPEPGLVIRYAYLWKSEYLAGREEGSKDRPCAIVLTVVGANEADTVIVVPVTHTAPVDEANALEIPAAVKHHLQLDSARSWAVLSECNQFRWPGPDLRRTGSGESVAYGFLPPRFFAELRRRFIALELASRSERVLRTE